MPFLIYIVIGIKRGVLFGKITFLVKSEKRAKSEISAAWTKISENVSHQKGTKKLTALNMGPRSIIFFLTYSTTGPRGGRRSLQASIKEAFRPPWANSGLTSLRPQASH